MVGVVLGLLLGGGMVLVMSAFVGAPDFNLRPPAWWMSWNDQITRANISWLTPWRLVALSIVASLVAGALVLLWTGVWAVAGAVMLLVTPLIQAIVAQRAHSRIKVTRRAWPDVVDSLVSGVRSGAGLPELLCDLAVTGPEALRPHFEVFVAHYRAHGKFGAALDRLKERCADPVADRIVEALRLARQVGGADLSMVLRDLGVFLREEARTRGELEARQSWTVNAARLAVVAPWVVLVMVSSQPGAAQAWNSPTGVAILAFGAVMCVAAYLLMQFLGRLPTEGRSLR